MFLHLLVRMYPHEICVNVRCVYVCVYVYIYIYIHIDVDS